MSEVLNKDSKWYSNGLRFECTGCGQCCTGAPGFVWVNPNEIEEMATFLKISVEEFSNKYLRRVMGKVSLIEMPSSYDCVFLKDKKCQIYSVRPTQCRTFPWWPSHLKSEANWKEAATYCEGINCHATLNSFEKIEEQKFIQIRSSKHDI